MVVHLLRNPASGAGRRGAEASTPILDALRTEADVIDLTGSSADASAEALRRAVGDGLERLVVAGGDGLVNMAIQSLAGRDVVLALAPTGTGNDFAAALGVDEPTVDLLLGPAGPSDLLRVDRPDSGQSQWVASIAIAGFPADINRRANSMTLPIGSAIYTMAAALELPRFRRRRLDVTVDDERLELDSAMLAVGNTRFFGGGMLACPDARHDDGFCHLTSIEGVGRAGILRHLTQRSGGSASRPEVTRRQGSRVTISSVDERTEVWGDGEYVGDTPLRITAVPGVLQVAGLMAE